MRKLFLIIPPCPPFHLSCLSSPPLTRADILAFQFSSWYPTFAALSMKSTIIRPLAPDFRAYLDADGVFVPTGSEDVFVRLLMQFRLHHSRL